MMENMEASSPRIRTLLRQAERVAEAGKRAAAEKLYRQIIEEAPDTPAAWIGLAELTGDTVEREEAYRRALELAPDNERALRGLEALRDSEVMAITPTATTEPPSVDGDPVSEREVDEALIEVAPPVWATADQQEEEPSVAPPVYGEHAHAPEKTEEVLYCANHPTRRTHLRCNRCGRAICSSCARPTPVGYRCPQCIREQEEAFFSATPLNYLMAALVAFPLALLAGMLATRLGFFVIFLAAFAGTAIGRIAFRVAGRKRGRWLPHLVSLAVIVGGVLPALPYLLALLFGQPLGALSLIWVGIYIVVASGSAFYQVK